MNTKKATKRALLTSVMALVMCVVMLVGTTFAWFTDTASTGVNKIQAGNLDVQLLMRNASGAYVNIGDSHDVIFGGENSLAAQNNNQDTLWEPGKTQVAYLAVRNAGNLALKYNILLNVRDEGLIGALDYAIVPQSKLSGENQTCTDTIASWVDAKGRTGAESGKLTAGTFTAAPNGCLDEIAHDKAKTNETEYFALVVHMDENAGNTYMKKSVSIDMKVVATQAAAEFDSFNNQYDKDAPLDFEPVATADELKAAAAAGKNVQLTQDVTLAEALTFDNEVTIDLNGKTLGTTGEQGAYLPALKAGEAMMLGQLTDGVCHVPAIAEESLEIRDVWAFASVDRTDDLANASGGLVNAKDVWYDKDQIPLTYDPNDVEFTLVLGSSNGKNAPDYQVKSIEVEGLATGTLGRHMWTICMCLNRYLM